MVNFCAMVNCGSRSGRDKKSFYRLPAVLTKKGDEVVHLSKKRRTMWLAAISRDFKDSSLPYVRVCSDHFIKGKPSDLNDCTNPDWVPSLKLGHDKIKDSTVNDTLRYERTQSREDKRRKSDAISALLNLQQTTDVNYNVPCINEDVSCSTESQTILEGNTISGMQNEIATLQKEVATLRAQQNFNEDFFKDDDDKVRYYTGLVSYQVLMGLLEYVTPLMSPRTGSMTIFQCILLTLMKLRLNISHVDLGYRFHIATCTASRIFLSTLDILFVCLNPLIIWPEREQLHTSMPLSFRTHFGKKVTIIIDCFEIFIDRPSNLAARATSWSSYKHNNTVKYLIGVTPQGSISYISDGWGGRVSDKFLVEHSNFLLKLNSGDVVLADRGFNIDDSVATRGAEIKYPVFTKGKKQLSGKEVEETRRIANVRIHVERVIGCLRQKYSILHSTIPIDYVYSKDNRIPTLDKLVYVCCALTNMCPSVVPLD